MTTCLDCGFNHVLNVFIVGFKEDDTAVLECPSCGSDDCVKDSEARKEGHDPSPIENFFSAVESMVGEE